jgi:hypothetical protein
VLLNDWEFSRRANAVDSYGKSPLQYTVFETPTAAAPAAAIAAITAPAAPVPAAAALAAAVSAATAVGSEKSA